MFPNCVGIVCQLQQSLGLHVQFLGPVYKGVFSPFTRGETSSFLYGQMLVNISLPLHEKSPTPPLRADFHPVLKCDLALS